MHTDVSLAPPTCYAPAIESSRAGPSYWTARREALGAASSSYTDFLKSQIFDRLQRAVADTSPAHVASNTIWYAQQFVSLLPTSTPAPEIVVEDDGEIGFDWGTSARSTFSVSVGRDGVLRFAGLFEGKTRFGSDQLTSTIPSEILAHIAASSR